MSRQSVTGEKALRTLQQLVRRPPPDDKTQVVMTKRLPSQLATDETPGLALLGDEVAAMATTQAALLDDLRFEHMRNVEDAVWEFVAECWLDRRNNHVPMFIAQHEIKPFDDVCYVPVEFLTVPSETEVFGIRLLPVDDERIPTVAGDWFGREKPIGSFAAVDVQGTDYRRMAERARRVASHALRVLRIALREHRSIANPQLRFRLGRAHAFAGRFTGWQEREDVAYDLTFAGDLPAVAGSQPVSTMPAEPSTDVGRKADLALRWLERAWFANEPLIGFLYLFFALEALLGDKREGLKAHGLAFRQAMLGHLVTGMFSHPNETWFLYDQVRSGAVHGEDAQRWIGTPNGASRGPFERP